MRITRRACHPPEWRQRSRRTAFPRVLQALPRRSKSRGIRVRPRQTEPETGRVWPFLHNMSHFCDVHASLASRWSRTRMSAGGLPVAGALETWAGGIFCRDGKGDRKPLSAVRRRIQRTALSGPPAPQYPAVASRQKPGRAGRCPKLERRPLMICRKPRFSGKPVLLSEPPATTHTASCRSIVFSCF